MTTEGLGVSTIQRLLDYTEKLVPHFNRGDKVPLTDGHVDIYSKPGEANKHWDGRVNVQIKGALTDRFPTEVRYRLTRTELANHQKNGGVVLFYVLINKATREEMPYYVILDPFAISAWMGAIKPGKNSVLIPMRLFPEDEDEIEHIMRLALQTKRHNTETGVNREHLANATALRIYAQDDLDFRRPVTLSRRVMAFSAELVLADGGSIPLPGDLELTPSAYTDQPLPVTVSIGDIVFKHATRRTIDNRPASDADTYEVKPGPGITLLMRETDEGFTAQAQLEPPPMLTDRLRAVEFFLAMARGEVLELNGKPIAQRVVLTRPIDDVGNLEANRDMLMQLTELFEHLGVDRELANLEETTSEALTALTVLRRTVVDGIEHHDPSGHLGQFKVTIGDRQIILLSLPGSDDAHWRHVSPFAAEEYGRLRYSNDDSPTDTFPITAYDLLTAEDLPSTADEIRKTLNLDLPHLVDAYKAIAETGELITTTGIANQFVLALVRAADAEPVPSRRDELLDAAARLCDWLLAIGDDSAVYKINAWQIMHRQGSLGKQERTEIRGLSRTVGSSGVDASRIRRIELSCALLLGDAEATEDLIADMPKEELDEFKTWPIWALHRDFGTRSDPDGHGDGAQVEQP